MDIEQLSKSQTILLTLFVSFVTSVATGIVTVSLMEQAPPAVEQTVNRIVERTVEKVVPSGQPAAIATVREKTVVVKASDLIAQAVQKVTPSVVRLYTSDRDNPTFLGFGLVVDASGTIVSDNGAFGDVADAEARSVGGTSTRVFVVHRDKATGLVTLQTSSTTPPDPAWASATIVANSLSVGQSVAAVAGKSTLRVGSGIVTAISSGSAASDPKIIDTDVSSDMLLPGAILMTTEGEVAGMSTAVSRDVSSSGFVPISAWVNQVSVAKDSGGK